MGDLISAYLFIIALEVLFVSIKKNENIKPLNILDKLLLYTAYADDVTFFSITVPIGRGLTHSLHDDPILTFGFSKIYSNEFDKQ